MSGTLYIVATPIGNLQDITLRALDVLAAVDVIMCEDTRVTRKLMQRHGLTTRLRAYHEHNAAKLRPRLMRELANGVDMALVSDAGTPLISDPGYRLVAAARDADISVVPIPGASAPVAALSVAGLPTDRFSFLGFPPPKGAARRKMLAAAAQYPGTLIFFETPRRLAVLLAELAELLGDRVAAVGRELTKKFEETRRDNLRTLAAHYAAAAPPKGELVVMVAPSQTAPAPSEAELRARLAAYLKAMPLKAAAAQLAQETGQSRRALYALGLRLRGAAKK